jgi:hypothetical protein
MKKFKHLPRASALVLIMLLSALAALAITSISSQIPVGPYPGTVGAGALAITFTAADVSNGNSFPITGREVLLIWNSDSIAHTVTLTSVTDLRGRSGDVTAYSVAATSYAAFNFRAGLEGWRQSDGTIHFSASDATVKFAVLYIP